MATDILESSTRPDDEEGVSVQVDSPLNGNVKALAQFFQSKQQQDNLKQHRHQKKPLAIVVHQQPSVPVSVGHDVASPQRNSPGRYDYSQVNHAATSSLSSRRKSCTNENEKSSSVTLDYPINGACKERLTQRNVDSCGRPVPRPRISIIRKKWYSELILEPELRQRSSESSPATTATASAVNSGGEEFNGSSIAEEDDYLPDYDNACDYEAASSRDNEDGDGIYNEVNNTEDTIYEELPSPPASPHNATNGESSEPRNGKKENSTPVDKLRSSIGLLLQKSLIHLPERQIRRRLSNGLSALAKSCDTLLSDAIPPKPSRTAPRPPSVEQLENRPRFPDPPTVLCFKGEYRPYGDYNQVPLAKDSNYAKKSNYSSLSVRDLRAYSAQPQLRAAPSQPAHDIYSTIEESTTSDDYYQDIDGYSSEATSEELYNDAEDLYDEGPNDDQIYEALNCDTNYQQQRIQQEQLSHGGQSDSNVYQNDAVFKSHREFDKKLQRQQKLLEKKRWLLAQKLKKKFNVTGHEVPVNCGLVKEDATKSRLDIRVRAGETVLILRMEGNPPGKWLAKSEKGKVGYVELSNIAFDPESVKTLMNMKDRLKSEGEYAFD